MTVFNKKFNVKSERIPTFHDVTDQVKESPERIRG